MDKATKDLVQAKALEMSLRRSIDSLQGRIDQTERDLEVLITSGEAKDGRYSADLGEAEIETVVITRQGTDIVVTYQLSEKVR